MTLPAFAAEQTRHMPLLQSNDGTDRWTTDAQPFHRPCSTYYAGSINKQKLTTSGINYLSVILPSAFFSFLFYSSVLGLCHPSIPTKHSTHIIPSPLHSFIPGLKPSFSANPSNGSLPFLLRDWLHGFPELFTDTSEQIRSLLFSFSVIHFLVVGSVW